MIGGAAVTGESCGALAIDGTFIGDAITGGRVAVVVWTGDDTDANGGNDVGTVVVAAAVVVAGIVVA